ncbi:MAG TPA: alpha/beta hydrolase [Bacteroidota bacterium]|nr:alpha/beta hydrolase [Bacteroidota bacterium]
MSTRLFHFVLALIVVVGSAVAQQKVVNVWKGEIPGAIRNPSFKLIVDSNKDWSWTRNISNPTMDVYPAPAKTSSRAAVIICPGGGYWALAYKHEGEQIARWLNTLGVSAFVLRYRLPSDSIMVDKTVGPLEDGQEAVRVVRRHAREWNLDANKIGVMGFSAGGHLASTISTHFNDRVYTPADSVSARPDFSLLIYPVISMDSAITHFGSRINLLGEHPSENLVRQYSNELRVNAQTPPAFLIHSLNDPVVPVQNSINYALAMKNFNIPCELHIYETGGHGYGMGRSNDTEPSWPEACKKWLRARGFIK